MRRLLVVLSVLAAALVALTPGGATGGVRAADAATYDLGVRELPQPLAGRFERMPVRLWGAIGVPTGAGPVPVVVIGHGAATTGCPSNEALDVGTWPCWQVEQRSDLGFRYLVRALAARGFLAIAPDLNAAFTDGWGEPQETLRYGQVLDATLEALARANRGGTAFGRSLRGRVDLGRLAILGHSRGGMQALRWSAGRTGGTSAADVAAGRGPVSVLLLLEPTFDNADPVVPPDRPLTVVLGQCDGDVGLQGQQTYRAATQDPHRRAPVFKVLLKGANHAFFNTTWTAKGQDDGVNATSPACRDRLRATEQQRWLGPVAVDALRQGFGLATAPWMRRGAPFPQTLAGLPVAVDRSYRRTR